MKTNCIKMSVLLVAVNFFIAICFSMAQAEVTAVSGKLTLSYIKKEVFPIPDAAGHVLYVGESQGTNASSNYMDGATVSNISNDDLIKGSGPHTGYITSKTKNGNETIKKWSGIVKTVLSPEGKPITTFSGEWKYIKCSGEYEGCAGQGVYNGYFTAPETYVVEYKGILVQ